MIQRIQTLYLLIASTLIAIMLFCPIFSFETLSVAKPELFKMMPFGVKGKIADVDVSNIFSTAYMGVLMVINFIVSFFNIFLYRHRWVQMRICFVSMILSLGVQLFIVYYIFLAKGFVGALEGEVTPLTYSVSDVFPIVAIILTYLAFRGVVRDEMLIRSLNRIR